MFFTFTVTRITGILNLVADNTTKGKDTRWYQEYSNGRWCYFLIGRFAFIFEFVLIRLGYIALDMVGIYYKTNFAPANPDYLISICVHKSYLIWVSETNILDQHY